MSRRDPFARVDDRLLGRVTGGYDFEDVPSVCYPGKNWLHKYDCPTPQERLEDSFGAFAK